MVVVLGQVCPLLAAHVAHVAQARAFGRAQRAGINEGDDGVAQLGLDGDRVALTDDEQVVYFLILVVRESQGGGTGFEVDFGA